jgi:hypothetical protein
MLTEPFEDARENRGYRGAFGARATGIQARVLVLSGFRCDPGWGN